jgi:hypothetical protein
MILLLNSAMMPQEGIYKMERITKEEFCSSVQAADENKCLTSYIGYPQNIALIKNWTGVEVQLNRAVCTCADGDTLLIMKLSYRVEPGAKGEQVPDDGFEFFKVSYSNKL